jgi:hypothetical protein
MVEETSRLKRYRGLAGRALAVSLLCAGGAQGATLVADYEFNGNLASSGVVAPDLIAVDPDGVASFTGGVYNWGGTNDPAHQGGLTFDNSGGLLPSNDYSVELRFKFNEGDGHWRRVLDVNNRLSDDGLYIDPSNHLDIFPVGAGSEAFSTSAYHTVILTVGGGVATGFLDGKEQFSLSTTVMDINNPQNVVNLFLDNTVGGGIGEWSSGSIDFAKFYNGVITPGGPVPEPATWAMLLLGFAGIGFAGYWTRRQAVAR